MGGMVAAQWNDPATDRRQLHDVGSEDPLRRVTEFDLARLDAMDARHDETVN
jgi:hypothetical protein